MRLNLRGRRTDDIDVAQLPTRVKSDILEPLVILGHLFTSIHRLLGYVPVGQLDWFVQQNLTFCK